MGNKKKKQFHKTKANKKVTKSPSKKPQLINKNQVKYNVFYNQKNNSNKIELPKLKKQTSPKEVISLIFKLLKENIHIIFNSIMLFIFIVFVYGLLTTKAFSTTINIYIIIIAIFFMLIAMSYNKYLSGKVFTTILSILMLLNIYYMNDTYGYIDSLNSSYYETRTYYIVTFDNNINQNIYSINNKSIGLLDKNSKKITKILNNRISGAKYEIYDNPNNLYNDFYNEKTRAIILSENEYQYLVNNIDNNLRKVKILDQFETTTKI